MSKESDFVTQCNNALIPKILEAYPFCDMAFAYGYSKDDMGVSFEGEPPMKSYEVKVQWVYMREWKSVTKTLYGAPLVAISSSMTGKDYADILAKDILKEIQKKNQRTRSEEMPSGSKIPTGTPLMSRILKYANHDDPFKND